ncbi:MAG: PAS-domain containing protein, partial [Vicinamibacterales bacterium]|nr:PAS-domain containing protein [Vicinamibacterales bacterium]
MASRPDPGAGWPTATATLLAVLAAIAVAGIGLFGPSPWAPRLAVIALLGLVAVEAGLATRWVRRATAAVDRLAGGDTREEPEDGLPETQAFARAVNRASREHAARGQAVEAALRDAATQRDRLASIFTASSDGLLLYDDRRHIVAANPRVGELLGFTLQQLSGCPTSTLASDLAARSADPEHYQALLDAHFAEPDRAREDILIVERPRRRVLKRLSRPVLHDGQVDGRVFTYTDITAEWEVDRMKGEFVATASHELRTPLTSVHAALQVVVDGG